jgi:predicted Zn-dependent protease
MSNDDRGAQRAYEKAVALDAASVEASINLGNLLMREGRYDDAASRYRALTKANPTAEAWMRLMAADVAAGKCQAGVNEINEALGKDSHNGVLMQLFVRMTSTCAATSAEEKRMALDYGRDLYKQTNMAPVGEAYSLALAANGKFDDAAKTQEAAMFLLVRNGRRGEVADYREFLKKFQAHQLPDRPWPASSALFAPPKLAARPAIGPAPKTPVQPPNPVK